MKMNGKKISGRNLALPSALILGLGLTSAISTVHAEVNPDEFFSACQNVKLIKAHNKQELLELMKKGCAVDFKSVANGSAQDFSDNVLHLTSKLVSNDILKNLDGEFKGMVQKKIDYWKHLALTPAFKADYGTVVGRLRQDLTVGAPSEGSGVKIKSFATSWYADLALSAKNIFSKDKEAAVSKTLFPESVMGSGEVSGSELETARGSKLPKTAAAAQEDYKKVISQSADKIFLLQYLDKPTGFENGKATWSDAQWQKAIGKMVADLEKTKAKTDRDLLDPALLPLVGKYLETHKQDCGLIQAEVDQVKANKAFGQGLEMAAFMTAGAEFGIASKMSKGKGVLQAVGGATALLGGDIGVAMAYSDYKRTSVAAHESTALAAAGMGEGYNKLATAATEDLNRWVEHTAVSQGVMMASLGGGAFAVSKIFADTSAGRKALGLAAMELADGKQVDAFAAKATEVAAHAAETSPKEGAVLKSNVAKSLASPELNTVRDLMNDGQFVKAYRELRTLRATPGKEGLSEAEFTEVKDMIFTAARDGKKPPEIAKAIEEAENTCRKP